jgi:peptide chain release factor 3
MEGAVQVLYHVDAFKREPILAVVGNLQFDVVQARLESEYNVPTEIEAIPVELARWVTGPEEAILRVPHQNDVSLAKDSDGNYVALFRVPFYLQYISGKFPELHFDKRS